MNERITVVGLGPGDEARMTYEAVAALRAADRILLRWSNGPHARVLTKLGLVFSGMDDVYDSADDFDALTSALATRVLQAAAEGGHTVYGVPGGGGVGDVSVGRVCALARAQGVPCTVLPGISAAETLACVAGGLSEARIAYAADYECFAPDPRVPLLVLELDNQTLASEMKLRLLAAYPPEHQTLATPHTGGAGYVALQQIDRLPAQHYGACSALFLPPVLDIQALPRYDMGHLMQIIARLRSPDGCPWDREQTHETLKPYLIEEAWETLAAIDEGEDQHICEELGDVLLQVVLHARIGEESGAFDMGDVITSISRKMITRHPHVFGDLRVSSADEVLTNWYHIKKAVGGYATHADVLRDVPTSLPALLRAAGVQKKAGKVGFDFPDALQALEKVTEEAHEVGLEIMRGGERLSKEIGDLLFAAVNVARLCHVNAETALQDGVTKFIGRFAAMELLAQPRGGLERMTLQEMDTLWDEAKAQERQ